MTEDILNKIEPGKTALLVIDVQKAFTTGSMAENRLPNILSVVELARETELTVAFSRSVRQANGKDAPQKVYDIVPKTYRDNEPTCCAGTEDTDYSEGLEPRSDEYEVAKERYDAFHGTKLDYYLRVSGVETVLMTGINTNVCVEATARSAHERQYNVIYIQDCCASHYPDLHEAALENAENILGTVISSNDLHRHFE